MQISFSGLPVQLELHDKVAHTLITAMVNAEAYPGPSLTHRFSDASSLELCGRLQWMIERVLVRKVAEGEFQLTEHAMQHLRCNRKLVDFQRMLSPRSLPLDDLTQWELLCALRLNSWTLLPAPYRKVVPALVLAEDIPIEQRLVYFNRSGLSVHSDYLRCLLSATDLFAQGQSRL